MDYKEARDKALEHLTAMEGSGVEGPGEKAQAYMRYAELDLRITEFESYRDPIGGGGSVEPMGPPDMGGTPDPEPDPQLQGDGMPESLATPAGDDEFVYRDAGTGEFVTAEYAEANPDTTVKESVHATPAPGLDGELPGMDVREDDEA